MGISSSANSPGRIESGDIARQVAATVYMTENEDGFSSQPYPTLYTHSTPITSLMTKVGRVIAITFISNVDCYAIVSVNFLREV